MPKQLSEHELSERDRFRKELGARIRQARKGKFTQKEIAEALHVDQGLISRIENGQAGMPLEMFKKIFEVLGVVGDSLLGIDFNSKK